MHHVVLEEEVVSLMRQLALADMRKEAFSRGVRATRPVLSMIMKSAALAPARSIYQVRLDMATGKCGAGVDA